MSKNHKAKKRKAARKAKEDPTAWIRGINRQVSKENGTIVISRGIHTVHTSHAEKRCSRIIDRNKSIEDSEE
jgi:hypothetical protein